VTYLAEWWEHARKADKVAAFGMHHVRLQGGVLTPGSDGARHLMVAINAGKSQLLSILSATPWGGSP
jgi:hypothetical protein